MVVKGQLMNVVYLNKYTGGKTIEEVMEMLENYDDSEHHIFSKPNEIMENFKRDEDGTILKTAFDSSINRPYL